MIGSKIQFILYVRDQEKSKVFYSTVLGSEPILNAPGMTEFILNEHTKLGLMPTTGIIKILKDKVPSPSLGDGIPRCELYVHVSSPKEFLERAIQAGATKIEEEKNRDWGDAVAYCTDLDGHVLAFARRINSEEE